MPGCGDFAYCTFIMNENTTTTRRRLLTATPMGLALGTGESKASTDNQFCREPARETPVVDEVDVIVCGGGPAGVSAAIAAARAGSSVRLFEVHGCLGGVWTAGLLTYVIDSGKPGLNAEFLDGLEERRATPGPMTVSSGGLDRTCYVYDPEEMKVMLEELAVNAGVKTQLFTRVVATSKNDDNRLTEVITESKSGRQAWRAKVFIDATGDGDVGALAGCSFEVGEREGCPCQPLTMMALVHLDDPETAYKVANVYEGSRRGHMNPKQAFLDLMKAQGFSPSYGKPTLFQVNRGLFGFMINHEYGIEAFDAAKVTEATFRARSEIHTAVRALRQAGQGWESLKIVATAEQIGVRDGRRILGHYQMKRDDLVVGSEFDDGAVTVNFPVDIHAQSRKQNDGGKAYHNAGVRARPYQIPLRAMIAREVDGLMMAGRCISGDFISHASYRVTGNAVAMGEAAGAVASLSADQKRLPQDIDWADASRTLREKVWINRL